MFDYQKVFLDHFDSKTFLNYQWNVRVSPGEVLPWQGFYTGPVVLRAYEVEDLCELLLGIELSELSTVTHQELIFGAPVTNEVKSLFIHSTTPNLNTFLGDLSKIHQAQSGLDYTTYKETRSVYLANSGDLCVGRVTAWETAIETEKISGVNIENTDYYYLSQMLLVLARQHLEKPVPAIQQIIDFITTYPEAITRVYALEQEMQIFLVWLKRIASLDSLKVDSNTIEVSQYWNNKRVLYPSITQALAISSEQIEQSSVKEVLAIEGQLSDIYQKLKVEIPRLPGYVITRTNCEEASFIEQLIQAAKLLQTRYGLTTGCLKACQSGDGARITANIPLHNLSHLTQLAIEAYAYEDDYLLEAHVNYLETTLDDLVLKTVPSAHIRQGKQAPGIMLQFIDNNSWKGNLYLDAEQAAHMHILPAHYKCIKQTVQNILNGFDKHSTGVSIAGFDFAIGRIGGHFGDEVILGMQDPNVSFNGAECLRTFMDKKNVLTQGLYSGSLVIHPQLDFTLPEVRQVLQECFPDSTNEMEVISIIPDCWGMIAATGKSPQNTVNQLLALHKALTNRGVIY